jgi:hypothetical protein
MKKLPFTLSFLCAVTAASFTVSLHAVEPSAPVTAPAAPTYDFGDQKSSTLTGKAWKAFGENDLDAVKAYTGRCVQMYESTALTQQGSLTGPVTATDPAAIHANWALNDVGTCYFILGQALEKANKPAEALKAYKILAEKLSYAKCWDTKGWSWSPADAARSRVKALEFDAES